MTPIQLLKEGLNVKPVYDALTANPQLWDTRRARTEDETSPHYGLSDIWARFAANLSDYSNPHDSVWYKDVTDIVPIEKLAEEVLEIFPGKLGGVLITKIPSGKLCKPHNDPGWHARYYDKIGVSIAANNQQAFCFDDAFLVTKPGDAFWFDNYYTHWVPNISQEDRITAIFCIRPTYKGN